MEPYTQTRSLGAGISTAILERAVPSVNDEAEVLSTTVVDEDGFIEGKLLLNELTDKSKLEEDQESTETEVESPESTEAECSSVASTDSVVDFFSPEETVILFDWDDTICPTTAINQDYELEQGCESLQALTKEAWLTLEKAREIAGEVVIVTNATEGWVESSCENWVPGLRPILDMLEFASARSTWEPLGVTTPTGWKAATFETIVRRFYSRSWEQSWKNIIVIGDACYEHEALAQVASLAPEGPGKRCRAKSIRFTSQPSVGQLAQELAMLRESFDDIVRYDDDLDFCFKAESL